MTSRVIVAIAIGPHLGAETFILQLTSLQGSGLSSSMD